jgi:uncharacterized protein YndB with AHSA1/START domain
MSVSDVVNQPTFDLTLSRTIEAPAAAIFDAWTDRAQFSRWFGATRLIMDAVVDGLYFFETAFEGRKWPHYGRFVTIDRPRRLELTWVSEATRGRESVLTILLTARGNRTEIVLTHSGLPDDEFGRQHEGGWKQILEQLAAALEKPGERAASR